MRISLIIHSLSAGGAERVISVMANYWAKNSHQISLFTFTSKEQPFFPLHDTVEIVPLGLAGQSRSKFSGLYRNLHRALILRRELKKRTPEIVVSFLTTVNVTTLIACLGLKIPILISERVAPNHFDLGKAWTGLRTRTYSWADAVILQTQGADSYFRSIGLKNTRIIPNPVEKPATTRHWEASECATRSVHRILAMGRLEEQKGFDILIRAFSRLASKYPEWELAVWGKGGQQGKLESLRDQLGLVDRVKFPGTTREVTNIFQNADIFVLSSRYEGFPNVLCEAMAHCLPVISFDCPYGPADIICPDSNGILVPVGDECALADAMARLMGNYIERRRLGTSAGDILDRFGTSRVMALWDLLVEEHRETSF